MAKYETGVQLPSVAAVQKPGPDRYAVPPAVAAAVRCNLPSDAAVEVSWQDGAKLSVTVEPGAGEPQAQVHSAQAILQEMVGPDSVVPPFHQVSDSGTKGA